MRTLPVLQPEDSRALVESGLLLRGVFAVSALPESVRDTLRAEAPALLEYAQLLLFAYAGPQLWRALIKGQPRPFAASDPVDDFSLAAVRAHLEQELGVTRWAVLYPGTMPVPLQQLGALLGWHHPSPLRVGINATFGTWFAYRVALVAGTDLPVSPWVIADTADTTGAKDPESRHAAQAPCATCVDKPCIGACLGSALDSGSLSLSQCVTFRAQPSSPCALRCPAREACPIAPEHRYDPDQIRYHCGVSLRMIRG